MFKSMKKNLFFAFFAFAALAFVGCEPKPQPVEYTLAVNPTEVTLEMGGQVKLNAVVTPAGEQMPAITWTSSNEEVATVNGSGIVEAVGLGEATITATLNAEGVAPATCLVKVTNDAVLNNFVLGGYALFNLGATIPGTDTVITLSDGSTENCQLAPSVYYVWDEDIALAGNTITGAGLMFIHESYTYVIIDGPYQGYYIGSRRGIFVDTIADEDPLEGYVAQAGQLIDLQTYGDAWNGILNATTQEENIAAQELYFSSQIGTQIFHMDWTSMSPSFNYGNISYAQVVEDDSLGLVYDLKIEWYDFVNPDRFYGLAVTEEITEAGDTTFFINDPYDMRVIHKEYNTMPIVEEETEVSALEIKKPIQLNAEQARRIEDLYRMYKK